MKAVASTIYYYSGDYYSYTVVTTTNGISANVYSTIPSKVKMSLDVNLLGELVITSDSKMQLNGYVQNIRDRAGDEIYINGKWQITQTAPVLGPLGTKSGYKYRAKLISGDI
jgi:hypothetical protein